MKRFFSLVLSFVMVFSIITGMDVSVFAADTEQMEYNIPRAEYYAENFSDIMILENSSFPSVFLESLQEDSLFMGEVAVWESLHIAESPADAAERGLITKADYYKTVLFDLLISKKADSATSSTHNIHEYLVDAVSKSETSFMVKVTQSIIKDKTTNSDFNPENFVSLPLDIDVKESIKSCFSIKETLTDVTAILGICTSAYEAINLISNYCALKDVANSTIEVLNYIANDTNNDKDLCAAATDLIEHVEYTYESTFQKILDGTTSTAIDTFKIYTNNIWSSLMAKIPGVNLAYAGIMGGRVAINLVFSEDERIACYYQLEASVACENALLRAMDGLKTEFSDNKTIDTANNYMKAVDMYKSTVLLGYDYSIELLETIVNCNWNVIIGSYNEAVSTIENIRQNKNHKINNYNKFEELTFKIYVRNYFPDYYTTLKYLKNTYVSITSMEVRQIEFFYAGQTYSFDESFSVDYLPKNNTEEYMNVTVTSSDENIIKVLGTEITAVNEGECDLTFVSEDERFIVTKTIIVQEYPENGYDYLSSNFLYLKNESDQTVSIQEYIGDSAYVLIPSYIDGYKVVNITDWAFNEFTNLESVTISNGVTSIGREAFRGCTNLISVKIPDSVTTIGLEAFRGCTNLTTVKIPDSVTNMGSNVFSGCDSLVSVTIPDNFTTIPYGTFYNCISLLSVTIPDSVTSIGSYSFHGCANLSSITIPDNVISIGKWAFYNCVSLTDIVIPDSVTSIGQHAFRNCTNLTSVKISNNVTSLEDGIFWNCNNLTSIIIPDGVTSIEYGAFLLCEKLETITIPDSVISIGNEAFKGCECLKSISIGNGVKSIGNYAFYNCYNITSITIPDNVISIGEWAFGHCTELNSVTIGNGVTNIGHRAFYNCIELRTIAIGNGITNISNAAFGECPNITSIYITDLAAWCTIDFFYADSNPLYNADKLYINGELAIDIVIPEGVTSIGQYAFYNYQRLKSVTIPDSVTNLGISTFSGCTNLETIIIPKSVTHIDEYAFNTCDSLEYVFYNGSETNWTTITIGDYNSSITSAIIHYNSTNHNYEDKLDAEVTCTEDGLKHSECIVCGYSLEPEVIYATGHKFENKIDIAATCTQDGLMHQECILCGYSIEAETIPAFGHDYSIEWTIDKVATCTEDGSKSHHCSRCDSKTDVTVIIAIGHNYVNGSCTYCDDYLGFEYSIENDCVTITSYIGTDIDVVIPSTILGFPVTVIGKKAFDGCWDITSVTIPDSVTSICENAFYFCTELSSITIPDSVTFIGKNAFYYCSDLTSINVDENNPNYSSDDGVLFNKDKTSLIQFPNGKNANEYTIPNCVITIADCAFYNCTSLTSITIPNSVINIGKYAFYSCSSLITINIPSSTTNIDSSAFDYCENLTAINVDENNSKYLSIDGVLIDKNKSQLIRYPEGKPDTEYVIPAGVTSIYIDSFYRCSKLTTITISEGVTEIEYFAFYNCTNLASVIISNSVKKIGFFAFYGCTKLSSVTIPDGVTNIGTSAFDSSTQIYCYENSAAHNYAVDNSHEYILIKLHSVNNKVNIDYDNSVIFSFTDICTDIEKIISTALNYILSVSESLSAGNTKLYGTGSKIVVEDELSNTTEYTIITVGDLNGDSVCDVLDAAAAQLYSAGFHEPTQNEIYAANGCISDEIDVNSYQNVVNTCLAS